MMESFRSEHIKSTDDQITSSDHAETDAEFFELPEGLVFEVRNSIFRHCKFIPKPILAITSYIILYIMIKIDYN